MAISINLIEIHMNIPECMTAENIWLATIDDEHKGMLTNYTLHGWPATKAELQKEIQPYWSFRDEIVTTGGITIKGRRVIIPTPLQKKALDQLHINHMGIDETPVMWVHLLDQHKCWHKIHNQKLPCMSWFPGNKAKGEVFSLHCLLLKTILFIL